MKITCIRVVRYCNLKPTNKSGKYTDLGGGSEGSETLKLNNLSLSKSMLKIKLWVLSFDKLTFGNQVKSPE